MTCRTLVDNIAALKLTISAPDLFIKPRREGRLASTRGASDVMPMTLLRRRVRGVSRSA